MSLSLNPTPHRHFEDDFNVNLRGPYFQLRSLLPLLGNSTFSPTMVDGGRAGENHLLMKSSWTFSFGRDYFRRAQYHRAEQARCKERRVVLQMMPGREG